MSDGKVRAFHVDDKDWIKIFDEHMQQHIFDKRMISAEDEGIFGPGSLIWHSEDSLARHALPTTRTAYFFYHKQIF